MTAHEKEEIRVNIARELESLERSITTFAELVEGEVQSDANDWFTTKESNPSKEMNEYAIGKARKRIIMLKEVLGRIDDPSYGTCSVCGSQIPFGRMKAIPATTRCMNCS
ncbi:MAG: TraR/DksA C4-type zinc finger protein [Bacteroidales bacterium]